MAIYLPIVTQFNDKGLTQAKKGFKDLEGASAKAQYAVKKAAVPAGLALAALGGFMVKAAKGAEDAAIANEKLSSVLTTMGFGAATDRVAAYAESLEKTIAVDADVIKATQTKLATFSALTKTVGKAGGAFDRATKAALDMAAAGFGTAEGNAVQLGKALQDPIKGITALAKSGVTFTDQEKEKIKTLVESNRTLEAQDLILKAIEGQVGGTAEASASSFDKMKFSLAAVSDTFGNMLLPVIDSLAPKLASFSKFVEDNSVTVAILAGVVGGLALAIVAINAGMAIYTAVTKAAATAQFIFNAAMTANPIGIIIVALAAVAAAFVIAYKKSETFRDVVNSVINFAIGNFEKLANAFIAVINTVIRGINIIKPGKDIAQLGQISLGTIGGPKRGDGFSGLNIPAMADGGIVRASPGGTLALIGEGGRDEAVIPLDRMGTGGSTNVTINVNGGDPNAVVDALRRYMQLNGSVPIRVS